MPTPTTTTVPTSPKPIARKKLNELQTEVLQILYKFRFGNVSLISQYQDQSVRNSNFRLKNLLGQKYIGRFYDDNDRINRRQATYFLLLDAVRLLKANKELDAKGLHLLYANPGASPIFVNHNLRLFRMFFKLDELYGNNLEFFTSTEFAGETKFPKVRPDAYLSFSGKHSNMPNCMLDLLESNKPADQIRQRATRFINDYKTNSDWGSNYPRILLVCDNVGLERDIQRLIARTLDYRGAVKPQYYTTTLRALYGSHNTKTAVWSDVSKPEELLALESI